MSEESMSKASAGEADAKGAVAAGQSTPGPWRIGKTEQEGVDLGFITASGLELPDEHGVRGELVIRAADDVRIALVDARTMRPRKPYMRLECAVRDANARVIQAAPAYARAWGEVPMDLRGRVLLALPDWVARAIATAEEALRGEGG